MHTQRSTPANSITLSALGYVEVIPALGSPRAPAILRDARGSQAIMKKPVLIILALLLGCGCAQAQAQNSGSVRYKWHDGQGLVHFSDGLSREAMKYGYDLVNDHGLVIQHVPRQLDAAERVAANKIAAAEAAKKRRAQDIANAEAQILAAYPDEESYRISQQQALDTIDQRIRTTRINLRSQEKALTDLLGRAADIERMKKPVPKFLADAIAKQRDVVTGQRNALRRQQAERVQTGKEQAGQLARYRELKAVQDKQTASGN